MTGLDMPEPPRGWSARLTPEQFEVALRRVQDQVRANLRVARRNRVVSWTLIVVSILQLILVGSNLWAAYFGSYN